MKKRLSEQNKFPLLFNLGLHQQHPWSVSPDSPEETLRYIRKTETLVNPMDKSLTWTEFVTFFWMLLEARTKVAIFNNGLEHGFSYESWFEGTEIRCYEGPWVPGLWSNTLLKNPVPEIVILISVNSAERFSILRGIEELSVPILNLSHENFSGPQSIPQVADDDYFTYFQMVVFRFLTLRFQRVHPPTSTEPNELRFLQRNFKKEIRRLRRRYLRPSYVQKLWFPRKSLKRFYLKKKLFFSKAIEKKKRYISGRLNLKPLKRLWNLLIRISAKRHRFKKKTVRRKRLSKKSFLPPSGV